MIIRYETASRDARLDEPTEAELERRVGELVPEEFPRGIAFGDPDHAARAWRLVDGALAALLAERSNARGALMPTRPELVVRRLHARLTGFGALQPLLDDPLNEGVEVNGTHVWVVREGEGYPVSQSLFASEREVLELATNVVAKLGGRLDETSPIAELRLPDGGRLTVYHPAATGAFPAIVVRLHRLKNVTLPMLVARQLLPPELAAFLRACVLARMNLVISGPTLSGKTTLLEALLMVLAEVPRAVRLVLIEEVGELGLAARLPRVLPLQARPANAEGVGELTIRRLVHAALRGNPKIIIVGEARGAEAYDLLQAMNTGHDGSSTTAHANSPRDAIDRLTTMAGQSPERIEQAQLRAMIAKAVHLIVQLGQPAGADGRRVTEVYELDGMEGGEVNGQALWEWRDGALRRGTTRPKCLTRFAERGVDYRW